MTPVKRLLAKLPDAKDPQSVVGPVPRSQPGKPEHRRRRRRPRSSVTPDVQLKRSSRPSGCVWLT